MKKLIIINGTMGVGKTSVGQLLNESIPNSAFIDGDWCCKVDSPLTESIKKLYIENIKSILNNYLLSSAVTDIIFCWVIHKNEILYNIINNVDLKNIKVYIITLQANELSLKSRITKRLEYEKRDNNELKRSLYYQQKFYKNMPSYKIDTSNINVQDVAEKICEIVADESKSICNNSKQFNNVLDL